MDYYSKEVGGNGGGDYYSREVGKDNSHPIAEMLAPILGAIPGGMAGGALAGTMVEPGIGTMIGAMLGSGVGAAGGEALREHMQGEQIQPKRLMATGAGYGLFPAGAEYGGAVTDLLANAPAVARFLPQNIGKVGTVLNAAIRAASGSVAGRAGAGVLTGEEPSQTRAALLPAAGMGAVTGGVVHAFSPPQLGGGNFWEAIGGNRRGAQQIEANLGNETADHQDWHQQEQARIEAETQQALASHTKESLMPELAQAEGEFRAKQAQVQGVAAQQATTLQQQLMQEHAQTQQWLESEQGRVQQDATGKLGALDQQEGKAQQGMIQRARAMILTLRNAVKPLRQEQGQVAYQPIVQLADSIPDTVDAIEHHHELVAVAKGDPQRVADSQALLRELLKQRGMDFKPQQLGAEFTFPPIRSAEFDALPANIQQEVLRQSGARAGATLSAKEWVNVAKKAGKAFSRNDLSAYDVRTAIANVLERHAPEEMKGAFAKGNQQWADHANDVELDRKFLQPGRSDIPSTETGARELQSIAKDLAKYGDTSQDVGYWKRLERDLGYSPLEPMLESAKQLQGLPEARSAIQQSLKEEQTRLENVAKGRVLQSGELVKQSQQQLETQTQQALAQAKAELEGKQMQINETATAARQPILAQQKKSMAALEAELAKRMGVSTKAAGVEKSKLGFYTGTARNIGRIGVLYPIIRAIEGRK